VVREQEANIFIPVWESFVQFVLTLSTQNTDTFATL